MARTRKIWAYTIVRSDAHTTTVLGPDANNPGFDVEVCFKVPARTADEAVELAYQTLDLEEFTTTTEQVGDEYKVICFFGMRAASAEAVNDIVQASWKGTPAWRAVLREVEMFANYSVLS